MLHFELIELLAKFTVFSPLITGLILLIFRNHLPKKSLTITAAVAMVLVAISSWITLFLTQYSVSSGSGSYRIFYLQQIISTQQLVSFAAIRLDMLSAIMLAIVTTVSCVVHTYSLSYMSQDNGQVRFMAYLSIFTFAMLFLVVGDDLIQIFMGWEGVGVMSYLLIGFWFGKESANTAAQKAFIVNRICDVALLSGIIILVQQFGVSDLSSIFSSKYNFISELQHIKYPVLFSLSKLDVICLLLLLGCMGKSAQIIFHIWLPDAMEGPTPVSALIHAATMVTAGVFLIVRCSILFANSEAISWLILAIGSITTIFAATAALCQTDIKKIIAYSTCSQLGYMFSACGVGAYAASIFHLGTHAFFKALLFLGAGSVIHGIGGEQDIRKMGDLKKYMPYTFSMMLLGSMALCGIFPLAGFYSKDLILEKIYHHGSPGFFIFGMVGAALTSFYSVRLLYYVFFHQHTSEDKHDNHPHDATSIMKGAMFLLLIGSIFSGMVGHKIGLGENKSLFWGDIIASLDNGKNIRFIGGGDDEFEVLLIKYLGVLSFLSAVILFFKTKCFKSHQICQETARCTMLDSVCRIFKNAYYFDELYHRVIVKGFVFCSAMAGNYLEKYVFDGYIRGVVKFLKCSAQNQSIFHSGNLSRYITVIFLVVLFCVYCVLYHILFSG